MKVIEEIEHYHNRYGIKHLVFYDDALLVNSKKHLQPILKGLIERRFNLRLHTPNGISPAMISFELASLMQEAGFTTIRLSLETADPERQRAIGGKVTNEDFERALRFLSSAGFDLKEIEVYLMMGLPGQDISEVVSAINYVNSLGAKLRLASYSPIPGTPDWEKAVSLKLITDDADPLIHNNTIVSVGGGEFTIGICSRLRKYVNLLNEGLDRGVKLFDSFPISSLLRGFLSGERRKG
jgi:radical SAM superfamily enzyme YgiQ (UPF0313 family)